MLEHVIFIIWFCLYIDTKFECKITLNHQLVIIIRIYCDMHGNKNDPPMLSLYEAKDQVPLCSLNFLASLNRTYFIMASIVRYSAKYSVYYLHDY